jgi:peroxiredoxin
MIQERSDAIENFIKNEPASPATYFACKFLFQKPVAKLIFLGSAKMKEELPESDYTKRLVADAAKLPKTTEGAIAPEISLLSPEGDSVSLSDLRGKVVLIDFWASWCGPCRKENPNVKRVYDKFKDKGFEIYGVSLDDNAGRWKAAIAKDGLPWYHVSDLKGWRSSAAQLYGVHSIPQTFLIDKDGTIIKAGLRGPELEMYLDRLMGS